MLSIVIILAVVIIIVVRTPIIRYPSSTLFPFYLGVSLLKLNSKKKGSLMFKGLLGNLDDGDSTSRSEEYAAAVASQASSVWHRKALGL